MSETEKLTLCMMVLNEAGLNASAFDEWWLRQVIKRHAKMTEGGGEIHMENRT